MTSDHKPVFSTFQVKCVSKHDMKFKGAGRVYFELSDNKVLIDTTHLQEHHAALSLRVNSEWHEEKQTSHTQRQDSGQLREVVPFEDDLKLTSLDHHPGWLFRTHFFIRIMHNSDCLGQGKMRLEQYQTLDENKTRSARRQYSVPLYHNGKLVGNLKGIMAVSRCQVNAAAFPDMSQLYRQAPSELSLRSNPLDYHLNGKIQRLKQLSTLDSFPDDDTDDERACRSCDTFDGGDCELM